MLLGDVAGVDLKSLFKEESQSNTYNPKTISGKEVLRGDIWMAELEGDKRKGELAGYRPVIIVQNDVGNKYSGTSIALGITSAIHKSKLSKTQCKLRVEKESVVLAEQIMTINKSRLVSFVRTASPKEMEEVNKIILVSLGFTDLKVYH